MSSPAPMAPPAKSLPSMVPVQSPEVTRVKAPDVFVSPEPVRSVKDSELRLKAPDVIETPLDEESPPDAMPPVKVFEAFTVETRDPPAMVMPPVVIRASLTERPPERVLVAVLVW